MLLLIVLESNILSDAGFVFLKQPRSATLEATTVSPRPLHSPNDLQSLNNSYQPFHDPQSLGELRSLRDEMTTLNNQIQTLNDPRPSYSLQTMANPILETQNPQNVWLHATEAEMMKIGLSPWSVSESMNAEAGFSSSSHHVGRYRILSKEETLKVIKLSPDKTYMVEWFDGREPYTILPHSEDTFARCISKEQIS